MYREANMTILKGQFQKGFSLITAIFLLVVLSALGAMMVTFFVAQQQSSALDVMGTRAYQASRVGIEWAAYNIALQPAGTQWAGCAALPNPLFAAGELAGTLSPFRVALTCTSSSAVESASTIWIYDLAASAVSGGSPGTPDYVERIINVKLGR
jgi:MSHA biogenesis protein MshP